MEHVPATANPARAGARDATEFVRTSPLTHRTVAGAASCAPQAKLAPEESVNHLSDPGLSSVAGLPSVCRCRERGFRHLHTRNLNIEGAGFPGDFTLWGYISRTPSARTITQKQRSDASNHEVGSAERGVNARRESTGAGLRDCSPRGVRTPTFSLCDGGSCCGSAASFFPAFFDPYLFSSFPYSLLSCRNGMNWIADASGEGRARATHHGMLRRDRWVAPTLPVACDGLQRPI
jgi:hypothetical protein